MPWAPLYPTAQVTGAKQFPVKSVEQELLGGEPSSQTRPAEGYKRSLGQTWSQDTGLPAPAQSFLDRSLDLFPRLCGTFNG